MSRLSHAQVLESTLRTEEFDVEEWEGSLLLGEWPVERTAELMQLGGDKIDPGANPDFLVKLFIMGCIDPVFTAEDAEVLRKKSAGVMLRVAQKIMILNGLTQEAVDDARGKS